MLRNRHVATVNKMLKEFHFKSCQSVIADENKWLDEKIEEGKYLFFILLFHHFVFKRKITPSQNLLGSINIFSKYFIVLSSAVDEPQQGSIWL